MDKKLIKVILISLVVSLVVVFSTNYVLAKMDNKKVANVDFNESYEIVAGVIRNEGDGWNLIQDDDHETIGITNVYQDNEKIVIEYDEKSKVNSMAVTVDETMAAEGYTVGASVGLSETWLLVYDKEGNQINPKDYSNASGNLWIQGILKK